LGASQILPTRFRSIRVPNKTLFFHKRLLSSAIYSSDNRERYAFDPLPGGVGASFFRSLEPFSGTGNDEIHFRLSIANWNNPPKYEALLYTWEILLKKIGSRTRPKPFKSPVIYFGLCDSYDIHAVRACSGPILYVSIRKT
jgi:hypothetical protein